MSTESDTYASEIGFHRGTTDDTDRGLFLSGDGTNKQLFVKYNGNVGIGTTSPGNVLTVSKDQNTIADQTPLVLLETIGTANVNKGAILHLNTTRGSGVVDIDLLKITSADGTLLTVRNSGNVGIGTTGPVAALNVSGAASDPVASTQTGLFRIGTPATTGLNIGVFTASPYGTWIQTTNQPATAAGTYPLALNPLGGNVGIGTTAPAKLLDVTTATSTGTNFLMKITGNQNLGNTAYGIGFSPEAAPRVTKVAIVATGGGSDNNRGDIHFLSNGTADTTTEATLSDSKVVFKQSGNVGIGTTGPGAKLHVVGSAGDISDDMNNGNLIQLDGGTISSANQGIGIGLVRTGSQLAYIKAARENASDEAAFLAFSTQTAGGSHAENVRITSTGKVGIGTTGPVAALNVSGAASDPVASTQTGLFRIGTPATTGLNIGVFTASPYGTWIQTTNQPATAAGTYPLALNPLGGNVGIGTVSPNVALTLPYTSSGIGFEYSSGDSNVYHTITKPANGAGPLTFLANFSTWPSTSKLFEFIGDGGNVIMEMLNNGNVGIGTASPGYTLTVSGTAWCTSGAWTGSDLRWKENIKTLPDETLNKVLKLRGVSFDWKREEFKGNNFPEGRQIGLIAQEFEKEFPELVTTDAQGYKAIAYDRFTAVLLEAMKALQQGQQQQQNQDQEQQNQLQKQQREIESLKLEIANRAGEDATLLEAVNALRANQKMLEANQRMLEGLKQEVDDRSAETAALLEAINALKANQKEIEDMKAQVTNLEGKVGGRR